MSVYVRDKRIDHGSCRVIDLELCARLYYECSVSVRALYKVDISVALIVYIGNSRIGRAGLGHLYLCIGNPVCSFLGNRLM